MGLWLSTGQHSLLLGDGDSMGEAVAGVCEERWSPQVCVRVCPRECAWHTMGLLFKENEDHGFLVLGLNLGGHTPRMAVSCALWKMASSTL